MSIAPVHLAAAAPPWGTLIGGGAYQQNGQTHYLLSVFDTARRQPAGIPTSFLPHGIAIDPRCTTRVLVFEKIGPGACEVDLASGRQMQAIAPAPGHHFYGHGAFSADGGRVFATETALDGLSGAISVRDGDSLDYLESFPTHGHKPHDCLLIDDGKVLVVANAGSGRFGEAASVCYVEVDTGRLLERMTLDTLEFNAGHLAIAADGGLALVSAPRDGLDASHSGGVSLRRAGEAMHAVSPGAAIPRSLQGETLSVAIDPDGRYAISCTPDADLVCIWDMHSQALVKTLSLLRPRGVTLTADGQHFEITYGNNAAVVALSVDGLSLVGRSYCENSFITGSHVWNWERECQKIAAGRA
ncbi:DUF1513 domain-containing protein [Chitinimonas sp.]|uniref:DUF1513 domain-containing protein n=1 Tax=Chitinimonas sp. TaxID=1934313 RepID=UPI0035AE1C7D